MNIEGKNMFMANYFVFYFFKYVVTLSNKILKKKDSVYLEYKT